MICATKLLNTKITFPVGEVILVQVYTSKKLLLFLGNRSNFCVQAT